MTFRALIEYTVSYDKVPSGKNTIHEPGPFFELFFCVGGSAGETMFFSFEMDFINCLMRKGVFSNLKYYGSSTSTYRPAQVHTSTVQVLWYTSKDFSSSSDRHPRTLFLESLSKGGRALSRTWRVLSHCSSRPPCRRSSIGDSRVTRGGVSVLLQFVARGAKSRTRC